MVNENDSTSGDEIALVIAQQQQQQKLVMKDIFYSWMESCLKPNQHRRQTDVTANTTTDIQSMAKLYFEQLLVSQSTQSSTSNTIIISPSEALALLIQVLQPCFDSTNNDTTATTTTATAAAAAATTISSSTIVTTKYLAISCLVGSIQGCCSSCFDNAGGTTSDVTAPMKSTFTISFIELLCNFLLPYIGPIDLYQNSNSNEKNEMDMIIASTESTTEEKFEIYDTEQLRDLAMKGVMALIQLSSTSSLSSSSSSSSSVSTTNNSINYNEWIQFTCAMTIKCIEHRCTVQFDEEDDDIDMMNEHNTENNCHSNDDIIYGSSKQQQKNNNCSIESGLALLPRVRRSLCFTMLQNTVDSIVTILSSSSTSNRTKTTTNTIDTELIIVMVQYIQFIIRCLHGESDPRCLLQLLQLLYTTLVQFYNNAIGIVLQHEKIINSQATIIETISDTICNIFDAVVPYYPIQFHPPPNDTIGITRQSLRTALMNILSCTVYDPYIRLLHNTNHETTYDINSNNNTMSYYTCDLLLDCLLPSSSSNEYNDEPQSTIEQIELLEDLQDFLFYTSTTNIDIANISNTNRKTTIATITNLEKLDIVHQQRIADALIVIHEKSSLYVSTSLSQKDTTSAEQGEAKKLADLCRTIISKIAITTERIVTQTSQAKSNNTEIWQIFVEEPIRKLSNHIQQKQYHDVKTKDRIAIAYIACVASCGGSKALHLCLYTGLAPLLQQLKANCSESSTLTNTTYNNNNSTNETIITCIYGIGAFYSSCRVAIDIAKNDGISWYPHPLEPYCNETLEYILTILRSNIEMGIQNNNIQITIAAIRTLESVILVSPISLFASEQANTFISFCESVSDYMESSNIDNLSYDSEFGTAYSQTFGTLLGQALDSHSNLELSNSDIISDPLFIQSDLVRQYFENSLLPMLLVSLLNPKKSSQMHIIQLLARSTSYSLHAASHIVQTLANALHAALVSGDSVRANSIATSLSFLFTQENSCAVQAYHELSHPNITSFDILKALIPDSISQQSSSMEIGISTLRLPTSNEERQRNSDTLEKAYEIILKLRKGYEHNISEQQCHKLIIWVDKVLPPLSDVDTFTLSIVLPILSAAMEDFGPTRGNIDINSGDEASQSTVQAIIGDLAEFALATEYHRTARLHAARCLHASIVWFIPRRIPNCPAQHITTSKILPALCQALNTFRDKIMDQNEREATLTNFQDAMNIFAMLGSAAACRGGGPSSKSSNEIFRVLVDLACTKKAKIMFGDEKDEYLDLSVFDRNVSTVLSIQAAESIGMILGTHKNRTGLWRQRLTNIALKKILEYKSVDVDPDILVGQITCLCHVLCCTNLPATLSANQGIAAGVILCKGLSMSTLQVINTTTLRLLLVSILKTICVAPGCFRSIYPLVTGSLHAYAIVNDTNDGVICKILSMQVLATVAQLSETDFGALDAVKTMRPAVLALLGTATNHPLAVLRSAAVQVRNIWTVVLES